MKKLIVASIAFILLSVAGCSHRQVAPEKSTIDDLVASGIVVNMDSDEKQLVKKLGEPLRIEVKAVENAYYDFDDAAIYYHYPGLEVIYYHHKHPDTGWKKISRIEVSNNDYDIDHGIKIGMDILEVIELFGHHHFPVWEENGFKYIGYETSRSVHEQVIFEFKDNVLTKFIWSDWP